MGSDESNGPEHGKSLGLPTATALVTGSIIGTGIFTLPAAIARYGMLGLAGFVLATLGAIALGLVFASLSAKMPGVQGGPYAFAHIGFGDVAGFINAFMYWCAAWPGNAGIVISIVFYGQVLFDLDGDNRLQSIVLALVGLWIPVVINLRGTSTMGVFQTLTVVLKFLPLVFVATVGLFYAVRLGNWPGWNPSGEGLLGSLSTSLTIATFSYIGIETAAIAAARVRHPARNVPRATLFGTLTSAIVYLLVTIAIFGIMPNESLQASTAPFSDVFNIIFGGSWGGKLVAGFAIISGLGALNGWTMICGEVPQAAARDGLFPQAFARSNRNGVPAFGIIVSTVLASIAVILALSSSGGVDAFTKIVQFAGVAIGVPFFFSVLVQIYWLYTEGGLVSSTSFGRDVFIAIVALVFSLWIVIGSGQQAAFLGLLILLLGFVVMMVLFVESGTFGPRDGKPDRDA